MKRFLSVFIAILFVIPFSAISAFSLSQNIDGEIEYCLEKIDSSLNQQLQLIDDEEYVTVWVWLQESSEEELYQSLSSKYNFDLNSNNEEQFLEHLIELKKGSLEGYKLNSIDALILLGLSLKKP